LIGGVDKNNRPENNFTEEQFKAMRRLLRYYTTKYPKAVVVGHNELDAGKACPSFNVQEWLKEQTWYDY
jgi:N-acetyl-anhydromuramyl-L-alanine amidase AmpD